MYIWAVFATEWCNFAKWSGKQKDKIRKKSKNNNYKIVEFGILDNEISTKPIYGGP